MTAQPLLLGCRSASSSSGQAASEKQALRATVRLSGGERRRQQRQGRRDGGRQWRRLARGGSLQHARRRGLLGRRGVARSFTSGRKRPHTIALQIHLLACIHAADQMISLRSSLHFPAQSRL